MSRNKLVECPVTVDPQHQLGAYANAFRVLDGPGDERVLDFLIYSEVEGVAELVSRVRIHREILSDIRAVLGTVLGENSDHLN